jgi:hypothetical protein
MPIEIRVYDGKDNAANETFLLVLSNPTNATLEQISGRRPGEARATFR